MTPLPFALRWAIAYGLTQAVEVPIYLAAMRGSHEPIGRRMLVAFGASALTHPFVAILFPFLFARAFGPIPSPHALTAEGAVRASFAFVLFEGFAILAEAGYLHAFGIRRPLRTSLVANLASSLFGVVLTYATGLP
jgi:hypothetical protein